MHILFWIIVAVIAGALAKSVVGAGPGGTIGDLVIGLVGALLGGWLFTTLVGHSYGGWVGSTVVAFVGAVVLLLIMRSFYRRPAL